MPFSPTKMERARKQARLTQNELGYLTGAGDALIRKYEAGTTVPGGNRVQEIANVLGVPIADLYDDVRPEDVGPEAAARARIARLDQGIDARVRRSNGTRQSSQRRRKDD